MSENNKQNFFTPFNVIAGTIIVVGLIVTFLRFYKGLEAVTNLDNNNPWGIWIGFDLLCGVALAAGGYVTSSACYLFGLKRYHSAVRPAILTAFLGYFFVVIALLYDLGRPWRLPYPMFLSQGTSSVLFEVSLCVALYVNVLFLEFSPAVFEWFGIKKFDKIRDILVKITIPLTILGVILSTMHQSSLGGLYLIAPSKLHPLWYSAYINIFFFVSSIVAGLSMVILEGSISHKHLHHKMDETYLKEHDGVVLGFAKAASFVLIGYFFIKMIGVVADNNWHYLNTNYGYWFLLEIIGFVLMPSISYAIGYREKNFKLIKITSLWAVLGIVLNRLNVSVIAFNYHLPASQRYFPSFSEIIISIFIVTLIVVIFRFISSRMPIFYEDKKYSSHH